jgi:hypothetical protein
LPESQDQFIETQRKIPVMSFKSILPLRTKRPLLALLILILIQGWPLSEVQAQYKPGAIVTLHVVISIVDEHGKAVPDATVTIQRTSGNLMSQRVEDGKGTYDFDFMLGKDYTVRINVGGREIQGPVLKSQDLLNAANTPEKKIPIPILLTVGMGGVVNASVAPATQTSSPGASPEPMTSASPSPLEGEHGGKADVPSVIINNWIPVVLALAVGGGLCFLLGVLLGGISDRVLLNKNNVGKEIDYERIGRAVATAVQPIAVKVEALAGKIKGRDETPETSAGDNKDAAGESSEGREHEPPPASESHDERPATSIPTQTIAGPLPDTARSLYVDLASGNAVSPGPVYLDADLKSSPMDLLEEREVFLKEVSHHQGSIVMFSDSTEQGWIFPNPKLFDSSTMKRVFPEVTETDFDNSKDNIMPRLVTRESEGRWKVHQQK